MGNSLKSCLLNLVEEEPSDGIVSVKIRELIEKIFDENDNKINWKIFWREYKLLVFNERQFDSAVRVTIISVLEKGGILSFKESGNYKVSTFSSSRFGKENAIYSVMGQGIYFVRKDDALDFMDAFNKIEGKKAKVYFTQEITR